MLSLETVFKIEEFFKELKLNKDLTVTVVNGVVDIEEEDYITLAKTRASEINELQKDLQSYEKYTEKLEEQTSQPITEFRREFWFLSNFSECKIEFNGMIFDNVEAAFQACKCPKLEQMKQFQGLSGKEARALGRKISPIRANWEEIKGETMQKILIKKFKDPKLAQKLLDTGDRHISHVNKWGDTYFGVCNGKGSDYLGKILLGIRKQLKEKK